VLTVVDGGLAYRHELAREAVETTLPPDRRLALHRAALSNGIVPVIPAVTVAEGYRTEARSDRIGELLAGTEVEPFSGEAARRSGEIAARCDTSDLSVVAVVEVAERRNCAVVAQRQTVLRTAASLLGHELVLYAV